MPYDEREQTTFKWVMLFVLISLLVHALVFLAILLITLVVPAPKLDVPPQPPPEVTLSLQPAPVQPPPPQHLFMHTSPQPNAPTRETMVESDNDTQLASQSKKNRADSIMPDVVAKTNHSSQLENSPNSPTRQMDQAAPAPPTPKEDNSKPTPPQPKPAPQQQVKPPEPQPPKPSPPQVTKNQVDPVTGLPVLPPINAPTLAPQSTQPKAAAPPLSIQSVAADLQGRAGLSGAPTPESTATELGKYKAKVYLLVGNRWYGKLTPQQLQLIGVGMVKIQYTIHFDGTVETKVLEGGNLALFLPICLNSITESAPFDPFTDSMRKQVGDSYTDYFTFTVYDQ
jgi:hypothetical protein